MTGLLLEPTRELIVPASVEQPAIFLDALGDPIRCRDGRPQSRRIRRVHGGAVTASGLFVSTFKDLWDNSDLVIDWVNDTVKYALYNNSVTPNFSTDTAYGTGTWATTPNQITNGAGSAYTIGGYTLLSKTVTESPTGTIMFDCADPTWTTATFSGVRCGLMWDDTIASPVADPVIGLHNFGADFAVTAGTFTVLIAATGAFTDDMTP